MVGEEFISQKEFTIVHKAPFNMIDLYHSLKAWFEINRYTFYEREHEEKINEGKKSLSIKWRGLKEIDDYNKFRIDISISLKNYEIITKEKEKLVEGDLKIGIRARIIVDYEEKWSNNPTSKFLRDLADKFFNTKKHENLKNELENDAYDIYSKAKSFLNLQKFK